MPKLCLSAHHQGQLGEWECAVVNILVTGFRVHSFLSSLMYTWVWSPESCRGCVEPWRNGLFYKAAVPIVHFFSSTRDKAVHTVAQIVIICF